MYTYCIFAAFSLFSIYIKRNKKQLIHIHYRYILYNNMFCLYICLSTKLAQGTYWSDKKWFPKILRFYRFDVLAIRIINMYNFTNKNSAQVVDNVVNFSLDSNKFKKSLMQHKVVLFFFYIYLLAAPRYRY